MGILHLLLCFILVMVYHRNHMKRRKHLPHGPPSLPLLGSIPFMRRENGLAGSIVHPSLHKYDPYLCTVWIGTLPLIIIQDYALARELFSRDDFCGRSNNYHDQYVRGKCGDKLGIITTEGHFWQEQRQSTLRHLRHVGFGHNRLDLIIQDEVIKALAVHGTTGKDVRIDSLFNFPVINILWQVIASRKYYPDEPETKEMMGKIHEYYQHGPSLMNFVPFIRPYVPLLREDILILSMKQMIRDQITEHKNTFDDEHEPDLMT